MAGNGKRTVVSLKEYESLKEAALKIKSELIKCTKDNQTLRSMVDSRQQRYELVWFSSEMERVLHYNDATKGNSYRKMKAGQFADKILRKMMLLPAAVEDQADRPVDLSTEQLHANRVLRIAVDMANYSMMIGVIAMSKAGKLKLE